MQRRVSIVIPVYNRERYLDAAVVSVVGQTFTDWELVILDDGSSDGSVDIARRFAAGDPRIRVVTEENGGVAVARNRGLAATDSSSEFVIFLDSDDMWRPDALDVLVAALDANPEAGSAHGLAEAVDADGRSIDHDDLADSMRRRTAYDAGRLVAVPLEAGTPFTALVHHNWVVTPGTQLIRRAALDSVGGFDPTCDPADDWDMALRLSRIADLAFVDRPILQWRRHDSTLSETSDRWRRSVARVRRKMLIDPTNSPARAAAARWACRSAAREDWRSAGRAVAARTARPAVRGALKAIDSTLRLWWWSGRSRAAPIVRRLGDVSVRR